MFEGEVFMAEKQDENLLKKFMIFACIVILFYSCMSEIMARATGRLTLPEIETNQIGDDNLWILNGNRAEVTLESEGCNGIITVIYSAILTLKNISGTELNFSFDYSLSNDAEIYIDDVAYSQSGHFGITLMPNEIVTVSAVSSPYDEDASEIKIRNIEAEKAEISLVRFSGSMEVFADGEPLELNTEYTNFGTGKEFQLIAGQAQEGMKFAYWEIDGKAEANEENHLWKLKKSDTCVEVNPVFAPIDTPIFFDGEGFIADWESFMSSPKEKIILAGSGKLPAGKYEIPKEKTLVIPYSSEDNGDQVFSQTFSEKKEYVHLEIDENAELNLKGKLLVNGVQKLGTGTVGGIAGEYGSVLLNGKITAEEGSLMTVRGTIIGTGEIELLKGARAYEMLEISDYRGESVSISLYVEGIYPFNQYILRNIQTKTKICYGANLGGEYAFGTESNMKGIAPYIGVGEESLFYVCSGTVVKNYQAETGRVSIDINGEINLNRLAVRIGSINLNNRDREVPISGKADIYLNSGAKLKLNEKFKFMPGLQLFIEENALCEIAQNAELYVYRSGDFGSEQQKSNMYISGRLSSKGTLLFSSSENGNGFIQSSSGAEIDLSKDQTPTEKLFKDTTQGLDGAITEYTFEPISLVQCQADNYMEAKEKAVYHFGNENYWYIGETAAGHVWDEGKPVKQPSCTENGKMVFTCTTCSEEEEKIFEMLEHSWSDGVITIKETCLVGGEKEFTCKLCSETRADTIPAFGHTWGEWEIIKEAECTENGERKSVCETCYEEKSEDIEKLGHSFGSVWIEDKAATCEETGIESYHCENDGCEKRNKETEIPVLGHAWKAEETAKIATCTEEGEEHSICTICNMERTEVVSKRGHRFSLNWIIDRAATCENPGIKSHHCENEDCEERDKETEIPMLEHTWDNGKIAKQSTCAEAGEKIFSCTMCKKTKSESLPILAHKFSSAWIIDKRATCEESGVKSHHCEYENCRVKSAETSVSAKGHAWSVKETVSLPTCTRAGEKTLICTTCDKTKTEAISALGHNFSSEWTIDRPSVCEETGVRSHHCRRENCSETANETTIPVLGHSFSSDWMIEKAATCESNGIKSHHCERENCVKTEDITEISAKGHGWDNGKITKEATCTGTGVRTYTCKSCAKTKTENISVIAHSFNKNWVTDKVPSCTEHGTESRHCDNASCMASTDKRDIPPIGHRWNSSTVKKAATCDETGEMEFACTICGEKKLEGIDIEGHKFSDEWTVDKAPACTEFGVKSRHCAEKDCTGRTDVTDVQPLGHSFGEWTILKNASCTAEGKREKICDICGEHIQETLQKTEHIFNEKFTIDVEASCVTAGHKSQHCMAAGCTEKINHTEILPKGHNFSSWKIEKEPTCINLGERRKTCITCGEIIKESLPVVKHKFADKWMVDRESTAAKKGEESRRCVYEGCGERTDIREIPLKKEERAVSKFKDIKGHWAKKEIEALYKEGIVKGKSSDMFAPNDRITRAEFIAMLARLSGEKLPNPQGTFSDVKSTDWFAASVYWGKRAGITRGRSKTIFAPNSRITREEMCAMVQRYTKYKGLGFSKSGESIRFKDDAQLSKFAKESVYFLKSYGIVNGKDGNLFAPKDLTTRAEVCVVVYRILTIGY